MVSAKVLFTDNGKPITVDKIRLLLHEFKGSYEDATNNIIVISQKLDKEGKVFRVCADRILKNYGMTRVGVFHGDNREAVLDKCWDKIGDDLLDIRKTINASNRSRDRYLLEIGEVKRKKLIDEIWQMTKAILPFTMSASSYGLVGASKILFSVLPEIVLPVDNTQWMQVFKTVDLGDVIRFMADDIQRWEDATGEQFNLLDPSKRLTTLPAVYNVVAMDARDKI